MTDTDTQDRGSDSLQDWLCDNIAFGRLDEMPNRYLTAIMFHAPAWSVSAAVVLSAKEFAVPDDSIELLSRSTALLLIEEMKRDINECAKTVRSWAVFEGFRRLGHVHFSTDVLLKELDNPMAAQIEWVVSEKKISELCIKWGEVIEAHMAQFKGTA